MARYFFLCTGRQNRRSVLTACWIGLLTVMIQTGLSQSVTAQQFRVFIGTYSGGESISKGIYTSVFDAANGKLSEPVLASEAVNPAFLAIHPSGKLLYAVNEVSEGGGRGNATVSAYRIGDGGILQLINQQPSHGGAPCHCNVDATGKFLLVANYMGGNIVVYPIGEDGALGGATANVQHTGSSIDKGRQEGPHAHSINLSSDNKFAYAADLGIDQIRIYQFNATEGTLTAANPEAVSVTAGGGPRHFAIHPSGKFAYTNNELTSVVTVFERNPESGSLKSIQELSTLPAETTARRSTAECLVHPSGRFVYVSNRGHESIAVYEVDEETGRLKTVEITQTGGKEPRNFFIEPTGRWLLAENQNSDSIIVFSINAETGAIRQTANQIKVGQPVCIRMMSVSAAGK